LAFEHPSLRTRASSVAAVQELGGWLSQFTGSEFGLDTRESAEDVIRTLAQTCAIVALRVRHHGVFDRMAAVAGGQVSLINLLSDHEHPTQAIADVLTLADHFGHGDVAALAGRKFAYVGDANNVTRSLAGALVRLGATVSVGAPQGYQFSDADAAAIRAQSSHGELVLTHDPHEAVSGADAIYTDTWVSMGSESEAAERRAALKPFCVNETLMATANPGAVFLHCLPAHRNDEVTDEVLDGPTSLIWQQVHHRTSSMVGILRWLKESA
jgi:ornithine carbamoyltransferase